MLAADSFNSPRGSVETTPRAWAAVVSIAMGTFVLVTTEFLPVGLLTGISADLGVTEGTAGLLITLPGVVAAFAAPMLTVASGRIDRRRVLWLLSAIIAASNIVAALAPNLEAMLLARVLLGIGVGGFWAFAAGAGVRLVPAGSAGKATAMILAGISIGTVLGVPAGALIGDMAGWRFAFVVAGLFSIGVLIAQFVLLPALPVERGVDFRTLPALFRIPNARIGLVATVLLITGHFAAYTYLRPLLEHAPGMDAKMIAALLLVYGIGGFVGNFIAEASIRRSLRGALGGAALAIGLALAVATFLINGPVSAFVLVAVWGTAFGAVPLCLQTWMMRATAGSVEGGLALFISIFQLALALGAAIGGMAVDGYGIYAALFLGGALSLATAVFIHFARAENTGAAIAVPSTE